MKSKLLLTICALFLSISAVKADEVITIHLSNDNNREIDIKDIRKITFDEDSFYVHLYIDDFYGTDNYFAYEYVNKITFGSGVGVETIMATNANAVVAPNPTQNYLDVKGAEELYGSDLRIYSLTGSLVTKQSNWNGERIDVSSLNAGIYFVNIGATTVKFVKQ